MCRRHPAGVLPVQRLVAAASLGLALTFSLVACGDGPPQAPDSTGQPTAGSPTPTAPATDPPTAAGTSSPSPTPTASGALAPDRAVAVSRGDLVEIAIPTGEIVGELEADLGEGASSVVHSPPRNSVLLSRVITAARQEIVEIALGDGGTDVVAVGHTVAVAPDGQRFAVGRRELGEQASDQEVLEIHNFDGQVLRRWADPVAAEEPVQISHLTWSQDGTRLAFQLRFEDGTEVRTLNPAADGGSLQQHSRKVQPSGDLRMLTAPQFRPGTGTLTVVDGPGLDPDAQQVWRISDLEPDTDAVAEVLVETDRAVAELDFDPTGEHLLYNERHPHPPREEQTPAPPTLYHWHGGTSTEVTDGLTDIAW